MKKLSFFGICAVMVMASSSAYAADLPARPVAPAATSCWAGPFNGGYVGGHVDYANYRADRADRDGFFAVGSGDHAATDNRFGAGAAVGWDFQCGRKVFGIVVDWTWTDLEATSKVSPNRDGIVDFSIRSHVDWYGTVRTRAGLAIDDILLYVTGGVAFAQIDTRLTANATPPLFLQTLSGSFGDTRWGWVGGVGVEGYVWAGWTLKAEVLYMQFVEQDHTFATGGLFGRDFSFGNNDSIWVARTGLSWRFGGPGVAVH